VVNTVRITVIDMVPGDCTSRPIRATGFREPGFSKERRLEPQITIGLLTGQDGFPLMVSAFEGNRAETKTMLPVIEKFMAAHQLPDVTVVADAGMISEANQKAIEAAGLSFIVGHRSSPPQENPAWSGGRCRCSRRPTSR
jgi:transposase